VPPRSGLSSSTANAAPATMTSTGTNQGFRPRVPLMAPG
jgi:hypothetical protein